MLKNWFKVFLYNTKKNKLFTALNTLGLSIGIAGIILAILYWNDENSYDKWNPEIDNVYQVVSVLSEETIWSSSVAPLEPYLKEMSEISAFSYTKSYYENDIVEFNGQKRYIKKVTTAQNDFFKLFPFTFLKGSATTALNSVDNILLSRKTANFLFKDKEPIGEFVKYGKRNYKISGIFEVPGKSGFDPEIIINIKPSLKKDKDAWGNFNYSLLLHIKNANDVKKVAKKIEDIFFDKKNRESAENEGISLEEFEEKYGRTKIRLTSLKDARLKYKGSRYPEGNGDYQFLLIMVGLSVLILILSIVNYINLATANAIKRGKEVGIRKVVGASKLNIIFQFIFETVVTTLFAILIALAITELILPSYNNLLDKDLSVHNSQFFVQILLILIIIILVAGVFPAVYIANFKTLKVLKGSFDRGKSGTWLRNGMLVVQFSIASFFIIGSYIVHQQVNHLATKDFGFESEQVLKISYHRKEKKPKAILRKYESIKNELLKIQGVEKIALSAFRFGNGASSTSGFSYNEKGIQGHNMASDFDFFDIFNIKMKQGRALQAQFASDSIENININETAQRMMQEKNPIGKTINWNSKKLKIVGVVKDFDLLGPHKETPPMVFFHLKTIDWMAYSANILYVKISPNDMEKTIGNIESFWKDKVDQKYPFEYEFVDKSFAKTYEEYVKQRDLFGVLNMIVILIALFGLFSLASFTIERSMKSIAIKKTLGAETKTLLLQLSKQYVIFCFIGFLIAIFPVIYFLNKWLETFAYRIELSVIPFMIGFLALLILTLIIVVSRAYQATKVDVLTYLKYE